jgi:hypothetical protein
MSKLSTTPFVIDLLETGDQLLIHNNGDRFLIAARELANACGLHQQIVEVNAQVRDLWSRLTKWLGDQIPKVAQARMFPRGGRMFFLVVMNSTSFDGDLESALTDLDLEVANDERFDLLKLDVLAIPNSPEACIDGFMAGSAVHA